MEMIPDSNLKWDPGFLELYSGFESPGFRFSFAKTFPDPGFDKQKFSGLRNPDSLTKGEREDSSMRVLKRFFGTRDFPSLKLEIRDLSKIRESFGIESMFGKWDAKNTLGITGLYETLGRNYGIKEPYWRPYSMLPWS